MSNPNLDLQLLSKKSDKVLAVAHLVSTFTEDASFSTSEVSGMFQRLRVPISGVPQLLAALRSKEWVIASGKGRWGLTPSGEHAAQTLGLIWSTSDIERSSGAELDGAATITIPPELAPSRFAGAISAFLRTEAFESNVFGITRFPREDESDPIPIALTEIAETPNRYGLRFHLASDRAVDDELWGNVAASMWACSRGIAIVENKLGEGVNQNLLIEIGSMLMTGRRCVILKDKTVPTLPTDLVGKIYKSVDLDDMRTVSAAVEQWCDADLGLEKRLP